MSCICQDLIVLQGNVLNILDSLFILKSVRGKHIRSGMKVTKQKAAYYFPSERARTPVCSHPCPPHTCSRGCQTVTGNQPRKAQLLSNGLEQMSI